MRCARVGVPGPASASHLNFVLGSTRKIGESMKTVCSVCQKEVIFESYGVPTRPGRCPNCLAKPRHRFAHYLLKEVFPVSLGRVPKRFLEIGPSKTSTSSLPYVHPELEYTGVDIRELKHHERLVPPHKFLHMDARNLDFPSQSFDLVFANNLLAFVAEYEKILAEAARVLSNDGIFMSNLNFRGEPKTISTSEWVQKYPDLATPEFLTENGTEWFFGDDFATIWRRHGLLPLRIQVSEYVSAAKIEALSLKPQDEFVLSFKQSSARQAFLEALESLNGEEPLIPAVVRPADFAPAPTL